VKNILIRDVQQCFSKTVNSDFVLKPLELGKKESRPLIRKSMSVSLHVLFMVSTSIMVVIVTIKIFSGVLKFKETSVSQNLRCNF